MEVDDGLSLEMVVVTLFSSFVGQSQQAIYISTTESGVHIKQNVIVKILQNSLGQYHFKFLIKLVQIAYKHKRFHIG